MKRMMSIACLLAGAALLAGCPKKATVVEPPDAGSQVRASVDTRARAASTSTSALRRPDARAAMPRAAECNRRRWRARVIYFDFDKSEIKPEFADIVLAHARRSDQRIRASSSSSRATPTSAARANTTSGWANAARRRCGAH